MLWLFDTVICAVLAVSICAYSKIKARSGVWVRGIYIYLYREGVGAESEGQGLLRGEGKGK